MSGVINCDKKRLFSCLRYEFTQLSYLQTWQWNKNREYCSPAEKCAWYQRHEWPQRESVQMDCLLWDQPLDISVRHASLCQGTHADKRTHAREEVTAHSNNMWPTLLPVYLSNFIGWLNKTVNNGIILKF